jgi:hypothetical protein
VGVTTAARQRTNGEPSPCRSVADLKQCRFGEDEKSALRVRDGDYTLRLGFTPAGTDGALPWSSRFQLPAPLGAVVHLDQARVVDGTSVQVGTLRLSPTALTAAIHVDPAVADASAWGVVGSFQHGNTAVRIDWSTLGPTDLDLTAGTYVGVDDAAGTWTLTVTELVGDRPDGSQVRLQGPWQFTFEVAGPAR